MKLQHLANLTNSTNLITFEIRLFQEARRLPRLGGSNLIDSINSHAPLATRARKASFDGDGGGGKYTACALLLVLVVIEREIALLRE